MTRDGVPAGPRGTRGRDSDDEVDLRSVDVAAVTATDVLLDRLAARRPLAEDLDDPAAAVLALLAAEVDLNPVPEDALRRELFDLGVWPLVPSGTPPASFLPPTEVLDLRAAVPAARQGEAGAQRPRQVRVRLLAVAAAAVVVAVCAASAAVTGVWNPVRGGSIIAGTDEGSRIEDVVLDGLDLVDSRELSAAEARLEDAHRLAKNADLTVGQRRKVDAALRKLAVALVNAGFPLSPELLPDAIAVTPAASGVASPSVVPTTGEPSVTTPSTTATTDPGIAEEPTTTDLPAPTQDEAASTSTTTRPSSTSTSRTTTPETSSTSSTKSTGPPSGKGSPTRTRTKTKGKPSG